MKKFILSILIVGASALYIFMRPSTAATITPPPQTTSTKNTTTTSVATPNPAQSQSATRPIMPKKHMAKMVSGYKDGIYSGQSVDAYYGYVQVQATVKNGAITNIAFLSYPNDRETSRYINSQAMPYLKQETLSIQSAKVNIISGATDTSLAFKQSLSTALAIARR